MKKRKIILNAIAVLAIAFLFVTGIISFVSNRIENMEFKLPFIESYYNEINISNDVIQQTDLPQNTSTPIPSPTEQVLISPSTTPIVTTTNDDNAMASITISTDRKTRTFDIMPNVDENTLKRNIGYLPSSALPGREGMCVLMGHRDTDFSILKYVIIGDVFTIHVGNVDYTYKVSAIEIVDSDRELRFITMNGSNLVLVTCYPFRYSGNAPRKIIIYLRLK